MRSSLSPRRLPAGEGSLDISIMQQTRIIKAFDFPVAYFSAILVLTFLGFAPATTCAAITRYAYAVNGYDNSVSMYTVDAASGRLRHNGWVFAGQFPSSIVLHPSGRFAYVSNQTGMSIAAYQVDASNGRLVPLAQPVYDPKVVSPFWQVMDPEGRYLFIAGRNSNNIAVMAVNQTTGELSVVAGSPYTGGEMPRSVAMHPSGRFVYMTSINHDLISAYQINPKDGTLKPVPGSPFAVGDAPQFMRIHPDGKTLFLTVWNDRELAAYGIDPTTGALIKKSGVTLEEGVYPFGIGQYPDGRYLYVANWFGGTFGFSVSANDGALTPVPGSPFANFGGLPVQAEVEPMGKNVYVTNFDSHTLTAYAVDESTGALRPTQNIAARIGPRAIAFLSGEKPVEYVPRFLFAANAGSNTVSLFRIDPTTGKLTASGSIATGAGPGAIAADPLGRFLFVANAQDNSVSAYTILADGNLKAVVGSPFKTGKHPQALSADANGNFLYVANRASKNLSVFEIHPQSGALRELTANNIHVASPYPIAVEPSDLVRHPSDRGVYISAVDGKKVAGFKYYDDGIMVVDLENYGSPYDLGAPASRVAFDPEGRFLYALDSINNALTVHTFNESTSALRANVDNKPVATGKNPQALAFHPGGQFVYVVNGGSNDISVFQVDNNGGTPKALSGRIAAGKSPVAISVDESGRFVYVVNSGSNNISVYSVNAATGKLSALGTTSTGEQPSAMALVSQIK